MLRRRWLLCVLVEELWGCSEPVLSGQFDVLMVVSLQESLAPLWIRLKGLGISSRQSEKKKR